MKVIVLAAGYATRLYPLTRNQPKPLLDVGGKPMLTWLLDKVAELDDVSEIVVVTNGRFHEQFESWRGSVDSAIPIRLLNDGSTGDENKLGAIADMNLAMRETGGDEDWLVVAADNLFDFDLVPYQREFTRRRRALLLLREMEDVSVMGRYNDVKVDAEGHVTFFQEKPPNPTTNVAAICLYFLPAGTEKKVSRYLAADGNPDAPGYFIQWLVEQGGVDAVPFEGTWYDIGNLETLEQARARFGATA